MLLRARFLLFFLTSSLGVLASCGSANDVDPFPSADAEDAQEPDASVEDSGDAATDALDSGRDTGVVTLNPCGGTQLLEHEGSEAFPGTPCVERCEGVLVCNGPNALRCVGVSPRNACGGCETLPSLPDRPCGACADGVWTCRGGDLTCNGPSTPNACGGCEPLDDRPSYTCNTDDGEPGTFACLDADHVECIPGGSNACGGVTELEDVPGTPCGACGLGRVVCDGLEDVACEDADWALNQCGGCAPLAGDVGEACGECGVWRCSPDSNESVFCDEDRNGCGGCSDLGGAEPGDACADGALFCVDIDTLECATFGTNACGGDRELDIDPGQPCGACGDGVTVCESLNSTTCADASRPNACGGCSLFPGPLGATCAAGATWSCNSEGDLTCATGEPVNACGGTGELRTLDGEDAELLGVCGECEDGYLTCAAENLLICDGVLSTVGRLWVDSDEDGIGDEERQVESCPGPGLSLVPGDCDDSNPDVTALNACGGCSLIEVTLGEPCDDVGSVWNCDETGGIECSAASECFEDLDGDGYGTLPAPCTGDDYALVPGDCDDADDGVNPGADEVPGDGVDNNCSGRSLCYVDLDMDGARSTVAAPGFDEGEGCATERGFALTSAPLDCDDTTSARSPFNEEVCDTIDNDCDDATRDGPGYNASCSDGAVCSAASGCIFPTVRTLRFGPGAAERVADLAVDDEGRFAVATTHDPVTTLSWSDPAIPAGRVSTLEVHAFGAAGSLDYHFRLTADVGAVELIGMEYAADGALLTLIHVTPSGGGSARVELPDGEDLVTSTPTGFLFETTLSHTGSLVVGEMRASIPGPIDLSVNNSGDAIAILGETVYDSPSLTLFGYPVSAAEHPLDRRFGYFVGLDDSLDVDALETFRIPMEDADDLRAMINMHDIEYGTGDSVIIGGRVYGAVNYDGGGVPSRNVERQFLARVDSSAAISFSIDRPGRNFVPRSSWRSGEDSFFVLDATNLVRFAAPDGGFIRTVHTFDEERVNRSIEEVDGSYVVAVDGEPLLGFGLEELEWAATPIEDAERLAFAARGTYIAELFAAPPGDVTVAGETFSAISERDYLLVIRRGE